MSELWGDNTDSLANLAGAGGPDTLRGWHILGGIALCVVIVAVLGPPFLWAFSSFVLWLIDLPSAFGNSTIGVWLIEWWNYWLGGF